MLRQHFLQKFCEALPGKNKGCIFKEFLMHFRIEPENFKQMAVAIAGQRGDAHAGQHFAQPLFQG